MIGRARMDRLTHEKATVQAMIHLFCRKHHAAPPLCEDCAALWAYAEQRLDSCPFGLKKPACQNCTIHCYKPEMRAHIREIMRYAGPRMILHHPVMALRHVIHSREQTET